MSGALPEAVQSRSMSAHAQASPLLTDPSQVADAQKTRPAHGTGKTREKLGLALAGGGFRASLFHVGVLRYLAQADLLRYVEVLSTVSGGSLVGALYVMRLKDALEAQGNEGPQALTKPRIVNLSRDEYLRLVDGLEQTVRAVVSKNLRMRLLLNPLRLLLGWMGGGGLAAGFAAWLDAHLFGRQWAHQRKLLDLRICAPQVGQYGGTENYNREALWADPTAPASAVTRLIINTTCLNSGGRFWFSHAEFGDWYLGYVRFADICNELWPRKWLLQEVRTPLPTDGAKIDELLLKLCCEHRQEFPGDLQRPDAPHPRCGPLLTDPLKRIWPLLRWWRGEALTSDEVRWEGFDLIQGRLDGCRQNASGAVDSAAAGRSATAGAAPQPLTLAGLFRNAEVGLLRRLKNFAWLLRVGRGAKVPVTDGMKDEALATSFVDALKSMDDRWVGWLGLSSPPQALYEAQPASSDTPRPLTGWAAALMELVIEIYQFRCAVFMSPHVLREWKGQPLSEVVAASAAFPPVFPPQVLPHLVDDRTVRRLGLTDGGVFDNLGTTALLDEQCTMVIASDPGGLFDTGVREVSVGRLGLMSRLVALLGERPNQLFRHELRERRRMGEALCGSPHASNPAREFLQYRALTSLSTFRIVRTRDVGDEESFGRLLADIRTDLDVFGRIEQDALIRQGEDRARQHIGRRFGKGSAGPLEPWLSRSDPDGEAQGPRPAPIDAIQDSEHWVLQVARHRFLRLFRLQPAWVLGAAMLALALGWAGVGHGGIPALWAAAASVPQALGAGMAPCLRDWPGALPWLWQRLEVGVPAAVLGLIGTVWIVQQSRFEGTLNRLDRWVPARLREVWRALQSHGPTGLRWVRAGFTAALFPLILPFLLPGSWWPWLGLPLVVAALLTFLALPAVFLVTPLYLCSTRRHPRDPQAPRGRPDPG